MYGILRLKSRLWSCHGHFSTQFSNYYSVGRRLSIIDKKYTHNLLNLGFLQIYIIQNILIGFRFSIIVFVEKLIQYFFIDWIFYRKKYSKVLYFVQKVRSCTNSFPGPSKKRFWSRDDFGHLSLIQNDSYFQIAQNQNKIS